MIPSRRLSSRRDNTDERRVWIMVYALGTRFRCTMLSIGKGRGKNWLHLDCWFCLDSGVPVRMTTHSTFLFRLLVLPPTCIEIVGIAHRATPRTLFTIEIRIVDAASLPPHRSCSIEAALSVREKCLLSLPFFR